MPTSSRPSCARPLLLSLGAVALLATAAPATAQSQAPQSASGSTLPADASAPPTDPTLPPARAPRGQGVSPRAGDSPQSLEEVVITARKRTERLIDVPVSANALSGAALERYALTDISSAGAQVPQVRIDHAASGNGAIVTIRGIGSASVDESIEQEVTINIDGVPVSRGRVVQQAFFDQGSIEILKGPQALYFGKNSPAGVISISSTNPGREFGGYARGGYETESDQYFGEFAVNLPITDTLRARVAFRGSDMQGGYTRSRGGPITDPAQLPLALSGNLPGSPYTPLPGPPDKNYPGDKDEVLRLSLAWDPTSRFDAMLKFLVANHEDRGDSMAGRIFSCGPLVPKPASLDFLTAITPPFAPKLLVDNNGSCDIRDKVNSYGTIPASIAKGYRGSMGGDTFTQVLSYLGSLTLNYRLNDNLTLTSVSGLYKYRQLQFSNYDETVYFAAGGQNNDYNTSLTQEFRLASSFSGPLNFTLGLFYENDDREFYQEGNVGYFPVDIATGKTSFFGSDDFFTTNTYSGFAELNYKLPYHIEIAGGARYTVEEKTGDTGTTYLHYLASAIKLASPVGRRVVGDFTDHNVSPQFTISWKPRSNLLFYGAYKEGFKSGGFSAPAIIPANATPQNQSFQLETAEGGEIGAKVSNLFGKLTADITAYHYTHSGLQLTAFDAVTTSYFTQNAASATIQGIEANASYRITRELNLRGSVGYNKARYDSFPGSQCWTGQPTATIVGGKVVPDTGGTNAIFAPYANGIYCIGGVQDLTGQPLSRAPLWTAQLGLSYDRPLFNDWTLGLTIDERYTSGYLLQTNNNPFAKQGGYYLTDMSARIYNAQWELSLIGRNVGDVAYAVLGGDKPLGPAGQILASVGLPRQVILQLTRRF